MDIDEAAPTNSARHWFIHPQYSQTKGVSRLKNKIVWKGERKER